jgi:hypothetical protein
MNGADFNGRSRMQCRPPAKTTDIAEDFNLGGRAATSHLSDRQMVGARSVRLKVGCAKPVLGLAGQLLYV